MSRLNAHEVFVMFLSLGVLIASARALGEVARRLNLPSVVGEILAGILLGPTVLGYFAPHWLMFLFPTEGPNAIILGMLGATATHTMGVVATIALTLTFAGGMVTIGRRLIHFDDSDSY